MNRAERRRAARAAGRRFCDLPLGKAGAGYERRQQDAPPLGVEPDFGPEDLAWLGRFLDTGCDLPPLRAFPASLLIALGYDLREADGTYGPSLRVFGVLAAMYFHAQGNPEGGVLEDELTGAVIRGRIAIMHELARRIGLLEDFEPEDGIFGDTALVKLPERLPALRALAEYRGTLEGVPMPAHVFNRVMVHLCAATEQVIGEKLPFNYLVSLSEEWERHVRGAA